MVRLQIDLSGSSEEKEDREFWLRSRRTPHCYRCGRFCRVLRDWLAYDGQGTQNYVTFDCKHCGVYTESMW